MDEACKSKIISEDFADMIIEYGGDISEIAQEYKTNCVEPIGIQYAVVYIPVNNLTRDSIAKYGYAAFPTIYGLQDTSSLSASQVDRIRNSTNYDLRGNGILIGFIDTGIEYTNKVFKKEDGTTKIVSIWDQTIQSGRAPTGMYYGTEYTRDEINRAINSENPLSVVASTDENGHGTFMAGVAAGTPDIPNQFSGVAPESELVVVKLKEAKQYLKDFYVIPDGVLCYQETDIMKGVDYLVNVARGLNRPIVICIGIGSSQGGHDGRGALSDYLSYLGDSEGIAVVAPVGNEGNSAHHFFATISQQDEYQSMELRVAENEYGFSFEIWGSPPTTYSIDILSPAGEYIPRIPARLGENREIEFLFEETVLLVDYQVVESRTGDQLIFLRMRKPTPGIWRFRVYGTGIMESGFHSWLPISSFIKKDTVFLNPNPDTTVTAPAAAKVPITVTAYNHKNQSLYQNASRGYTRINVIKPELAAPGVDLYGPLLNDTYGNSSGTSVAAAHTAGIAAMVFEWAIKRNTSHYLDTVEIKNLLIRGAKRDPNSIYPNREWGYGIIDIYNTFEGLRDT